MESILYNSNYGSNSRKIYEKFCETLNWDKSKSYKFGFRRPLFAHNADTERTRDVWFISHSNLNENIALAGN